MSTIFEIDDELTPEMVERLGLKVYKDNQYDELWWVYLNINNVSGEFLSKSFGKEGGKLYIYKDNGNKDIIDIDNVSDLKTVLYSIENGTFYSRK